MIIKLKSLIITKVEGLGLKKELSLYFLIVSLLILTASDVLGGTPTGRNWTLDNTVGAVKCQDGRISLDCSKKDKASIELSWDLPTQREDGSALTVKEIGAFVIEYRKGSGAWRRVTVPVITVYLIKNLSPGTYEFRIATVDSDNVQGNFSSTISETII